MNLVCAGASHLHSIKTAFSRRPADAEISLTSFQLNDQEYAPVFRNEGSRQVVNPRFDSDFRTALATARPAAVFLYLGGGEYAQTLTNGMRPFDFVRPDTADTVDDRRELISFDMVRAYSDWIVSHMAGPLKYFRGATELPLYQITLPPITPSETYILSQAKPERRAELEKTGIAPLALRSKIWETIVESIRELCAAHKVLVIEPPVAAIDENGCLLSEYWGDGIHANAGYGMLLLDHIIDVSRIHKRGESK
jgi:hypothetical protein